MDLASQDLKEPKVIRELRVSQVRLGLDPRDPKATKAWQDPLDHRELKGTKV
jgi:hypothetical protein